MMTICVRARELISDKKRLTLHRMCSQVPGARDGGVTTGGIGDECFTNILGGCWPCKGFELCWKLYDELLLNGNRLQKEILLGFVMNKSLQG